jgi:lipooligosaccharide transport system permease protein
VSGGAVAARPAGRGFRAPDVRLNAAWRLWQRNGAIYRRTYKLNLIPNFFEPFFFLVAIGLGVGAYLSTIQGVRYMDFIAPGLLATAAMYGTSFEVTFNAFVKLHFGKIYDAVMSTPLTPEDIALGELLWGTTRAFIYGMVFLVIAAFFGVVHTPLVALAPVATILVGMMFSVIGLTFTAVIPHIDYYTYYWTMFLTPMFLFSGIFFPLDRLPEWFQTAAWFVPLHQAVRLMRAITLTGDVGEALAAGMWIVLVTGGLFVLPVTLLRRRLVH